MNVADVKSLFAHLFEVKRGFQFIQPDWEVGVVHLASQNFCQRTIHTRDGVNREMVAFLKCGIEESELLGVVPMGVTEENVADGGRRLGG